MREARAAALPFVAWARVWSPLAPADWRDEAWQALALPGRFSDCESEFLSTFVVGLPAPPVPLLLHAALGRDGGAVREDWMRVIAYLGLRFGERMLPPDHLGGACEAIAFAIEREERVLIRELVRRYVEPWCGVASERLAASRRDDVVARLPGLFAAQLRASFGERRPSVIAARRAPPAPAQRSGPRSRG